MGVSSENLDTITLARDVLVNGPAGTGRQPVDLLAMQIWSRIGGPAKRTRAELFADLEWPSNALGTVWGDANNAYLGIYRKDGATGAGAWVRIGDLPVGAASSERIAEVVDLEASDRRSADQAIISALISSGRVWPTTAAGMAAVANGDTFVVADPNGEGVRIYQRSGATPVFLTALRADAALAKSWADGTLPGGAGTKSAREYAIQSEAAGAAAQQLLSAVDKYQPIDQVANLADGGGVAVGIDSLTDGSGGSTYRTYLSKMIRAASPQKGAAGYASLELGAQNIDGFFKTSGWQYNTIGNAVWGAKSFDGKGLYFTGGTGMEADYFSWAPAGGWRYARIFYHKGPTAGSFSARYDALNNSLATVVDCNSATEDVGYFDIDLGAYAPDGGGIIISRPVGDVFIQGIRFLANLTDAYVANIGVGGRLLRSVAAQDSTWRRRWWAALGFKAFILDAGMNDRHAHNADQHYADLTSIVTDIRAALPQIAILIVQSHEPDDAASTHFRSYTSRKRQVAQEKRCGFLDLRDWFGPDFAAANARGLMAEGVHQNDQGNRLKAEVLFDWVSPHIIGDPGLAPKASGVVREMSLPARAQALAVGTPVTLYDIGLRNGQPTCQVLLEISYIRAGTTAGKAKRVTAVIQGTTSTGAATGIAISAHEIHSNNAGDGQSGDFAVSLGSANGRVQIIITAPTYAGSIYVTGKIVRITGTEAGKLAWLW